MSIVLIVNFLMKVYHRRPHFRADGLSAIG